MTSKGECLIKILKSIKGTRVKSSVETKTVVKIHMLSTALRHKQKSRCTSYQQRCVTNKSQGTHVSNNAATQANVKVHMITTAL